MTIYNYCYIHVYYDTYQYIDLLLVLNLHFPTWGLSFEVFIALDSIWASSRLQLTVAHLRKIQTPHCLFLGFRGYNTFKTRWSGAEFTFEPKFCPLPVTCLSLSMVIPESKIFKLTLLNANQYPQLKVMTSQKT